MSKVIDTYLSIKEPSTGFFKDRGSKFYSYAFPVKTEEEVKERLKELKKEHFSARHQCYAFRLGADHSKYRASDDGEPSNSAGPPILGQIKAHDLTNVLIVNVRYFGGTKLGVSGLINANKEAALDSISHAEIDTFYVKQNIVVQFPYEKMDKVMRVINSFSSTPKDQEYLEQCKLSFEVKLSKVELAVSQLTDIDQLEIKE